MNKTFIFIGPTITLEDAQQRLTATYLPPVKYGDVYRITELYQPEIIGIIDGYFNQVPAAWHKEILWAMNQGVTVFGAASMGALRAAELDQFGMQGCGKIYQAYQSGVLPPFIDDVFEDDDEVAVIHGPAELGYKPASEAMVNIRFTLAKAQQQKLINAEELKTLTDITKSLFYPQRNYAEVFMLAKQYDIAAERLSDLGQWVQENKIDQKHLDALTMLDQINRHKTMQSSSQKISQPAFQHTTQWQTAIDEIDQTHHLENPVLDELRLTGERYFELLDQALASNLTGSQPETASDLDLNKLHQSPDALKLGLAREWQIKQSQATANQLSPYQLDQLLLAYLKHSGELSEFSSRAQDKKAKLTQQNNRLTIHDLTELDLLQLGDWYFTQTLGTELPDRIENYATQLGFVDGDDFYAKILDEYYYLKQNHEGG